MVAGNLAFCNSLTHSLSQLVQYVCILYVWVYVQYIQYYTNEFLVKACKFDQTRWNMLKYRYAVIQILFFF